ncbi:double zinc ribbon domain-containing protein [Halobellus sp. GM3]|uniref:double zinc ribbon domain-containing protein n=1 Tax=Halobellus sp. GM3 TaxID=3458410 RepID=UPI00403D857F
MSKITFRADDDLVARLEALETSKSEAMREALRGYLDGAERDGDTSGGQRSEADRGADAATESSETDTVDGVIRERVDALVADRLDELLGEGAADRPRPRGARDLNVNVTVDGVRADHTDDPEEARTPPESDRKTRVDPGSATTGSQACEKCGERVDDEHVYCPNCGEKASHRVFCECGDELRSDWAFCPGCGRRTSAADVLERP